MAELNIQEHFQVPEGYFDNLTEQVMRSLPEQKFQPMHISPAESVKVAKKGRVIPMWTRYAVAACVAGVVMVSAFTAFYPGADKADKQSPVASVSTTIADSAKKVAETIAPSSAEKLVLAKADAKKETKKVASSKGSASSSAEKQKVEPTRHVSSQRQSYDMDVNTGYDQSEMDRAAMYMGIDNQDISEMMYEGM